MIVESLQPGGCHVWWARPGDAGEQVGALLDATERWRLTRLRRQADRDRFVVACGLMRMVLAGYLGRPAAAIRIFRRCPGCGGHHGPPRLAPEHGLELSVAHAGDRVGVAVSRRAVGVDVEYLRPELPVEELARQVLQPDELTALGRLPVTDRPAALLIYSTRKEAVVKATGEGLTVPLLSFGVAEPGEPPRLTSWPDRPGLARQLSLHDLDPGPGHVAALAVVGDADSILERDGSALLRQAG
jgi:4'-phosphopantetheinyl transferase